MTTTDLLTEYHKLSNTDDDLLNRLRMIYKFIDGAETPEIRINQMRELLMAFDDDKYLMSELKTLLIISKDMQSNILISHPRTTILNRYNQLKKQ